MQPGNLLVQMFGQTIHAHLQFLLPQLDLRQTLVGERIAHHERRMSRSATQVHQAAFGQDKDRMAVGEGELIHLRFLLICDEITSSLDQVIQRDIIELLKQCVYKYHMAILFVSHDLSLVHEFCHQVLVLKNDGKIIEKGTIQQLYKSENEVVQNLLKAAYLNG